MTTLTTFEDVFNRLITEYKDLRIEISIKQNGLHLATFYFKLYDIKIKPLNKKQRKTINFNQKKYKKTNPNKNKIGLIILYGNQKQQSKAKVKIPFALGFNTMKASFSQKGATINSLGLDIIIKSIGTQPNFIDKLADNKNRRKASSKQKGA